NDSKRGSVPPLPPRRARSSHQHQTPNNINVNNTLTPNVSSPASAHGAATTPSVVNNQPPIALIQGNFKSMEDRIKAIEALILPWKSGSRHLFGADGATGLGTREGSSFPGSPAIGMNNNSDNNNCGFELGGFPPGWSPEAAIEAVNQLKRGLHEMAAESEALIAQSTGAATGRKKTKFIAFEPSGGASSGTQPPSQASIMGSPLVSQQQIRRDDAASRKVMDISSLVDTGSQGARVSTTTTSVPPMPSEQVVVVSSLSSSSSSTSVLMSETKMEVDGAPGGGEAPVVSQTPIPVVTVTLPDVGVVTKTEVVGDTPPPPHVVSTATTTDSDQTGAISTTLPVSTPSFLSHPNVAKSLPKEALHSLVQVYFERKFLLTEMLHAPSWLDVVTVNDEISGTTRTGYGWEFQPEILQNAVFCLAARWCDHPAIVALKDKVKASGGDGCNPWDVGELFFMWARNLVMESIEVPCVETVQALLLLRLYGKARGGFKQRGYIYAGIAARQSRMLSLHIDPDDLEIAAGLDPSSSQHDSAITRIQGRIINQRFTPLEKEIRRRLGWIMWFVNRLTEQEDCSPFSKVAEDLETVLYLANVNSGSKNDFAISASNSMIKRPVHPYLNDADFKSLPPSKSLQQDGNNGKVEPTPAKDPFRMASVDISVLVADAILLSTSCLPIVTKQYPPASLGRAGSAVVHAIGGVRSSPSSSIPPGQNQSTPPPITPVVNSGSGEGATPTAPLPLKVTIVPPTSTVSDAEVHSSPIKSPPPSNTPSGQATATGSPTESKRTLAGAIPAVATTTTTTTTSPAAAAASTTTTVARPGSGSSDHHHHHHHHQHNHNHSHSHHHHNHNHSHNHNHNHNHPASPTSPAQVPASPSSSQRSAGPPNMTMGIGYRATNSIWAIFETAIEPCAKVLSASPIYKILEAMDTVAESARIKSGNPAAGAVAIDAMLMSPGIPVPKWILFQLQLIRIFHLVGEMMVKRGYWFEWLRDRNLTVATAAALAAATAAGNVSGGGSPVKVVQSSSAAANGTIDGNELKGLGVSVSEEESARKGGDGNVATLTGDATPTTTTPTPAENNNNTVSNTTPIVEDAFSPLEEEEYNEDEEVRSVLGDEEEREGWYLMTSCVESTNKATKALLSALAPGCAWDAGTQFMASIVAHCVFQIGLTDYALLSTVDVNAGRSIMGRGWFGLIMIL
ncbi:hypothetical protein HDU76_003957, partial [Blyttiomyces sp. JEL0837]